MFLVEKPKFDIILEDGGILSDVYIKCKKGFIRNRRDLNNAINREAQVKVITKTKDIWIKTKDVYEIDGRNI